MWLYELKVMPIELCNGPIPFVRVMTSLIRGFSSTIYLCYLYDIIIVATLFEVYLQRIEDVLVTTRGANLRLNTNKFNFCCRTLDIFAHAVNSSRVSPDPDIIKAVTEAVFFYSTHVTPLQFSPHTLTSLRLSL